MVKGKGKLKRQGVAAAPENSVSGGEEKVVPLRRRGRPLKNSKKETEGKEETKANSVALVVNNVAEEVGKKRKSSDEIEEGLDSAEEENGGKTKAAKDDSVKCVGFRQSGSRRKSKPRRAAEVGVECYCY